MDDVCVHYVPLGDGCRQCAEDEDREWRRFEASSAALQGLAASGHYSVTDLPKMAVELADALLEELEQ